ncbi:MAG: hypothetical protein Rhims3KO_28920 [Hyphomicrobiales bacterium]
MATTTITPNRLGLSLAATTMLVALSVSAIAAEVPVSEQPVDVTYVGQKAPTDAPDGETTGDEFATVPGENSGGLVFANIPDLLVLAAEVGSARIDRDDDGQEYVAGSIDGINYALDVYNCDPECADLTFTASFEMNGVTDAMMNEWNASRRFGKAYIRADGDAVLQIAINTRYGITVETFRDDMVWWETVLTDYVEFIGFR